MLIQKIQTFLKELLVLANFRVAYAYVYICKRHIQVSCMQRGKLESQFKINTVEDCSICYSSFLLQIISEDLLRWMK